MLLANNSRELFGHMWFKSDVRFLAKANICWRDELLSQHNRVRELDVSSQGRQTSSSSEVMLLEQHKKTEREAAAVSLSISSNNSKNVLVTQRYLVYISKQLISSSESSWLSNTGLDQLLCWFLLYRYH